MTDFSQLEPARNDQSTSSKSWTVWVYGGLIGSGLLSGLILSTQAAWSRPVLNDTTHFLVAQRVVDGLPPPPPVIFGQESLANSQNQIAQAQHYLVVVNGDSKMVLSQVQQVQPTASVQEYNGQRFIQAGLFNDATTAQQQVTTLAASGITAQVVPVSTGSAGTGSVVSQTPTYGTTPGASSGPMTLPPPEGMPTVPSSPSSAPREVEFGGSSGTASPSASPPSTSPQDLPNPPSAEGRGSGGSRSYYVIIPGSGQKLESISNQVSRLTQGVGVDGMVQTGTSRGSHVRVGPFNSRSAANRWSRYFRDFGMDARVGYMR